MKFGGPGDAGVLFRNFSSGRLLEQTTLADIQYVINDTIHSLPWKLSADTLTVLGHLCKKATAISTRNNAVVIAWYCENIPLPIGPDKYGGLPGAILKIDFDNGDIVFTATKLSPAIDAKSMKIPSGKMITRAAFEKKMDEILGPPDSQGHSYYPELRTQLTFVQTKKPLSYSPPQYPACHPHSYPSPIRLAPPTPEFASIKCRTHIGCTPGPELIPIRNTALAHTCPRIPPHSSRKIPFPRHQVGMPIAVNIRHRKRMRLGNAAIDQMMYPDLRIGRRLMPPDPIPMRGRSKDVLDTVPTHI